MTTTSLRKYFPSTGQFQKELILDGDSSKPSRTAQWWPKTMTFSPDTRPSISNFTMSCTLLASGDEELLIENSHDSGTWPQTDFFLYVLVQGKTVLKWTEIGPIFFLTSPDLANLWGRTDFDFDMFLGGPKIWQAGPGLGHAWAGLDGVLDG